MVGLRDYHLFCVAVASTRASSDRGILMDMMEVSSLPGSVAGTGDPTGLTGGPTGIKRLLDVTLALILIILFQPFFLLFGLLIKLDSPGPIYFRQPRVGYQGRIFNMWKFRTM